MKMVNRCIFFIENVQLSFAMNYSSKFCLLHKILSGLDYLIFDGLLLEGVKCAGAIFLGADKFVTTTLVSWCCLFADTPWWWLYTVKSYLKGWAANNYLTDFYFQSCWKDKNIVFIWTICIPNRLTQKRYWWKAYVIRLYHHNICERQGGKKDFELHWPIYTI